jgi:hypothetical protein
MSFEKYILKAQEILQKAANMAKSQQQQKKQPRATFSRFLYLIYAPVLC